MAKFHEDCRRVNGTFYMVPFSLIQTADAVDADCDDTSDDYKFSNPRVLTESGQKELLDKHLSNDLRQSIKRHTLLSPLVCRWVEVDGKLVPQVVGGERRYRALDFLRRKQEMVRDPRTESLNDRGQFVYSMNRADEVYEKVLCQVFAVNNDIEALSLSWAENKTRINLTDGHEIAQVKCLRAAGASDSQILDILQREEKWLAETEKLINELDPNSLNDLLNSRIDRDSAIELAKIKDREIRAAVREAANAASQEACNVKISRLQRKVEQAIEAQDIAECDLADAEFLEDEDAIVTAKQEVAQAETKVKKSVAKRDAAKPVTKAKDVKAAKIEVGIAEPDADEKAFRVLSAKKIESGIKYINSVIRNDGQCEVNAITVAIDALELATMILEENILGNNSNFAATLKKFAANNSSAAAEYMDDDESAEDEEYYDDAE